MTSDIRIALVGNPNCGKSALFNALTGLKQKVANYPGATVERRTGPLLDNDTIELIDLPGSYSLTPRSPDEEVTRNILFGTQENEAKPDVILCVVDATNLAQHLRFTLELKSLGIPMILALNMSDLAAREQIQINADKLSTKLGIPVIETVAVRKKGLENIKTNIQNIIADNEGTTIDTWDSVAARQKAARRLAADVTISEGIGHKTSRTLDKIFLHPFLGLVILFSLLFFMFQAVFSWSEVPMGLIEDGIIVLQGVVSANLSEGFIASFLSDGILGGVGSVIVFLPQIIILFAFILTLESTGYMSRAAFLMDKLMASVGLNGRAFIPLLSSFACAIPGIMAARAIANPKDRLTTILIAPLMTCSARIPVYTVIIGAFIPNTTVGNSFVGLQGLVMFGLYLMGIVSALIIATVLKRTIAKGTATSFLLELPKYQAPNFRFIMVGLIERSRLFLRRAGTVIMGATVILWALASYPNAPTGSDKPDVYHSFAGMIGRALEVIFAPIGFNWEISIALVPGMAAREVAISSLGTVYSLAGSEEAIETGLIDMLNGLWSLPTALAFLAWYIYAPQCLSTIAVTRRETNGWKWPIFMTGYLFVVAYIAAFITYQLSSALIE
jgi:ferrous iron transport protein B